MNDVVQTTIVILRKNWLPLIVTILSIALTPVLGFSALFGLLISVLFFIWQEGTSEANHIEIEAKYDKRHAELVQLVQKLDDKKMLEKVIKQVRTTMTLKHIELEDLLRKLQAPVYIIMVQKYYEPPKLIRKRLETLGFHILGTGIYILPPDKCPSIKPNFDIAKWMEATILNNLSENYKYIINFATVIDIRYLFSKRVISKKGRTVLEVLQADMVFLPDLLMSLEKSNITLSHIIEHAKIDFLIDATCPQTEITKLYSASEDIMKELNCQTILDLRTVSTVELSEALSRHCSRHEDVAAEIRTNALFWHTFLKNH